MYLLDVNVLIAIADHDHIHHSPCVKWFSSHHLSGWATCPIVESGMTGVMSQPAYRPAPKKVSQVVALLDAARSAVGYVFLPDDVSVTESEYARMDLVSGPNQVTDAYLLGLCRKHGLRLATLDRGVLALQAPDEDLVEIIE